MEKDLGKLIISTKAVAAGRKTVVLISCVVEYLLGALILVLGKGIFADSFGGSTGTMIWILSLAFLFGYPTFMLITSAKGYKSYCDVYEHGVVGTSGVSANANATPQQNFQLRYDEIVNVTESGKTIFIYTQYTTLEVLALKNRVEATQEIRKRMKGNR